MAFDDALITVVGDVASVGVPVFVLGLVMAFSPTIVGLEIHSLASDSARRDVPRIVAGVVAGATLLCVLPALVSEAALEAVWHGRIEGFLATRAVDLVAGALIATAGVVQWRRAERPIPPKRRHDDERILFPFVVANTVLSASGATTAYLVVRLITGSGGGAWTWPVLFTIFLTAVAAPYLVLAWGWHRFPTAAERIDALVRRAAQHDWRRPVAATLIAVGLALMVWAVSAFLGRL